MASLLRREFAPVTKRAAPPVPLPPGQLSWAELVRILLRHARFLGATFEEAEDLTHDAVAVFHADPNWYDPRRGSVKAALKSVVTNRYRDLVRRSGRGALVRRRLRLVTADGTPAADHQVEFHARAVNRSRLIAALSPEERGLFQTWMSQRQDDLDGPAAAKSLGLTMRAYENQKKRLRRRCRKLLDELGMEPADLMEPTAHGVHS
jgi:DNA-directed RNA polymerase specialized sigma24 family protein